MIGGLCYERLKHHTHEISTFSHELDREKTPYFAPHDAWRTLLMEKQMKAVKILQHYVEHFVGEHLHMTQLTWCSSDLLTSRLHYQEYFRRHLLFDS